MSNRTGFEAFIATAHELADAAGAAILPHFAGASKSRTRRAEAGSIRSPLQTVPRKGNKQTARQSLPDHGLEGEEYGHRNPDARFRWVVDPIDGTRAFIIGMPIWGTLIGLLDGETPVIGMMDQPYTGERFWSGQRASYFRGPDGKERRMKTRACASLADAMLRPPILSCSSPRRTGALFGP